jgi:predicted RNase H-like HicB family nuclease
MLFPERSLCAEQPMSRGLIVVKAAYDADAAVWYVESSDLEGVNAEASSLEALLEKLPGVVLDLLEEAGVDDVELPIELVAHASTRVRRSSAA